MPNISCRERTNFLSKAFNAPSVSKLKLSSEKGQASEAFE
jgi:hypothetical protein